MLAAQGMVPGTEATAQNKVNLMLANGKTEQYATAELSRIRLNGGQVTVEPVQGGPTTLSGVRAINFQRQGDLLRAQGWLESAYAEWRLTPRATYHVYVSGGGSQADWTAVDDELVRLYADRGRVDVVGLRPGTYRLRIVPVIDGREQTAGVIETGSLTVSPHDRAGFAHKDYRGVGAYQDDGTLKPGAVVVYVNARNAKTVQARLSSGTFTGMQGIISAYEKGNVQEPLCIRITGLLEAADMDAFGSSAEGIQIKGRRADSPLHMTIEGIGEDATVRGFGFLVRGSASVEIRNLGIMRQMDDGISLDTDNSHIWLHHIDVFYGRAGSGDHAKGDGAIDVKSDSKMVTVSYCHFWDTGKSTMCGMKSESGPNYISYHHNWFDHSDSRHARIRTMSVHLWNNYFDGTAKYGIGVTSGASAFAEANYFRSSSKPLLSSLQGTDVRGGTKGTFSGEEGGIIKAYGNIYAETHGSYYEPVSWATSHTDFDCYEAASREERVPAGVVTRVGAHAYDNFDTDPALMYAYRPDAAADVPARVTGYYGAGRLNHGDLQFAFDNATDDKADAVNAALAALIDGYRGGGATPQGSGTTGGTSGEQPGEGSVTEEPSQPEQPAVSGGVVCSFDKTGRPSSSLFAVTGNGSNSKGTATYGGQSYDTCLKMESATNVTFTTTATQRLTLVFGDTETASFKLDGQKLTGTSSTYTVEALAPGQHTITKADSRNLFLIVLE